MNWYTFLGLSMAATVTMVFATGSDSYYAYVPAYGYTYDTGYSDVGGGGLFGTIIFVFVFVLMIQLLFGSGSGKGRGSDYGFESLY